MSIASMFESIKRHGYITDAEWKESEHPRDAGGQFASGNGGAETDKAGAPVREIGSVGDIPDREFSGPAHSFKLPGISTRAWKEKVGDSRPVLLKKNIIERNTGRHKEFLGKDKEIISNALYGNDQVLYCKPGTKPNYYSVVKSGNYYDVVNIDTDPDKKYNEIVDWRRIREKSFRLMKESDSLNKKDTPVGDQPRITGVKDGDRSAGLNSDLRSVYEAILYYEERKVKSIAELWEEIKRTL